MNILVLFGLLIGLVGFYFGLKCGVRNVRDLRTDRTAMSWSGLLPMFIAVCIGAALAGVCYSTSYDYNTNFRVQGFPFPEAVFERHGDLWTDFEGPLTLPFCVANALFGFLMPQCLLRIYRRVTRRASPITPA